MHTDSHYSSQHRLLHWLRLKRKRWNHRWQPTRNVASDMFLQLKITSPKCLTADTLIPYISVTFTLSCHEIGQQDKGIIDLRMAAGVRVSAILLMTAKYNRKRFWAGYGTDGTAEWHSK